MSMLIQYIRMEKHAHMFKHDMRTHVIMSCHVITITYGMKPTTCHVYTFFLTFL